MATDCLGAIWKYWWRGGLKYFFSQPKTLHLPERHMVCFSVHVQKKHVFCFQCSPFYLQFHCSVDTHYHVVLNWESCRNRWRPWGTRSLGKGKTFERPRLTVCHCRIHLHWPLDHWLLGWGPGQWSMVGWLCFSTLCWSFFFLGWTSNDCFITCPSDPLYCFNLTQGLVTGCLVNLASHWLYGLQNEYTWVRTMTASQFRLWTESHQHWNWNGTQKTQWHNDNDDMIMVRMYIHVYMTID